MKIALPLVTSMVLAAVWIQPAGAQTCKDTITATAPDSRYTVANGTQGAVTDDETGLMWKRCSEGQTWDGNSCTGDAMESTWQEALQRAREVNTGNAGKNLGHSDWRLPNKNELASLVEQRCSNPAINTTLFPGTPSRNFWSASPYALGPGGDAWGVNFYGGDIRSARADASTEIYVRLVRGGQ